VEPECGEGCRGTATDEYHADAEGVELWQSRDEPIHLTGAVRSAEVAEEQDQRGAAQEVAEAVRAVGPVHLSVAQLSGDWFSEAHDDTITLRSIAHIQPLQPSAKAAGPTRMSVRSPVSEDIAAGLPSLMQND